MTTDDKPDPLLWSARRERALRWLHTDLRGYPDEDILSRLLALNPERGAAQGGPAPASAGADDEDGR